MSVGCRVEVLVVVQKGLPTMQGQATRMVGLTLALGDPPVTSSWAEPWKAGNREVGFVHESQG